MPKILSWIVPKRCLAPSLHDGCILMLKQSGAYTLSCIFVLRTVRSSLVFISNFMVIFHASLSTPPMAINLRVLWSCNTLVCLLWRSTLLSLSQEHTSNTHLQTEISNSQVFASFPKASTFTSLFLRFMFFMSFMNLSWYERIIFKIRVCETTDIEAFNQNRSMFWESLAGNNQWWKTKKHPRVGLTSISQSTIGKIVHSRRVQDSEAGLRCWWTFRSHRLARYKSNRTTPDCGRIRSWYSTVRGNPWRLLLSLIKIRVPLNQLIGA